MNQVVLRYEPSRIGFLNTIVLPFENNAEEGTVTFKMTREALHDLQDIAIKNGIQMRIELDK